MLRRVSDADDYEVRFDAPRIGLTLELHEMDQRTIRVQGVTGPALDGGPPIDSGDILLAINGARVVGLPETVAALKVASRPLVLRLRRRPRCLELPPNFTLQRHEGGDDDSLCAVVSTASSDDIGSSAKTTSSLGPPIRARRLEWFRPATWAPPQARWTPETRQVLVSWPRPPASANHRLYVSRDWPVRVWRVCADVAVARSDATITCAVGGLEPGKSYVFRLRATRGALSKASAPIAVPRTR
ncbi:hypothetical protein SDRG_06865 [Saprolegnia diclina VS20]|uniref:Fibronectin type-III domain-containing protein n=1 Tax=Saprolegnia diclina (strain VS20) TaxID=1156394 RepID=T0QLI8_SAPDV|nr:hypothetical protein SDRG_06865 [Saprolegnia diclina VS20]EQC35576.1 hypothetical protein SDRG_06865 [Saprolegnia diclina VS20]|eukprot:XP_008610893.1 hypothetical protein SDRG_06865 [Saprolegnia diclina VS20]